MREKMKATGRVRLDLYASANGPLIASREGFNLLTDVGLAFLTGLWSGEVTWDTKYIAIGTGNTAANEADTELDTEITTAGGERTLATASRVTTSETNDTLQVVATFTFTDSFSIVESGMLDASSAGNLIARRVFTSVPVVAGNVLVVTWTVQLS